MKNFTIVLAALLLLAVPAFADVGPAPAAPDVLVSMQKGDGTPDLRVTVITYHCMGSNDTGGGAVDPGTVDLPCAEGACTNSGGWYYKFNPCYDFPEGYFSYTLNGETINTGYFNNTVQSASYEIVVDSESGTIKSINGNAQPAPPSCLTGFALAALIGTAFFAGKK